MMILLLPAILLFTGCLDNDADEKREEEKKLLQEYISDLEAEGLQVNQTDDGLYYVVKETGEGLSPTIYEDLIELTLTGKLIDGRIFATTSKDTAQKYGFYDSTNFYGAYRYQFGEGFPSGFNMGISMMKEGAAYKLIVPSELGYGGISVGGIPAFSTLIYDVGLEAVLKEPAAYEEGLLLEYLEQDNISPADSTDDGFYFISMKEGTSDTVKDGDVVSLQYKLTNIKDQVIDQTAEGNPFQFQVGTTDVIKAFEEAVLMMTLEQKAKVIIPWYNAYGKLGYGPVPPYTTLVYSMEVVKLE